MKVKGIEFQQDAIAAYCKSHEIARLAIFGSILRDDFHSESDIDILVELVPGNSVGLFKFAGIQQDLTAMFGRQVHLHTPSMLPPNVRTLIQNDARVQYAA